VHQPAGQRQGAGGLVGEPLCLGAGHERVPAAAAEHRGEQLRLGHGVGGVDEEVVDRAGLGGVHLDGENVHGPQREARGQDGEIPGPVVDRRSDPP
jgi:hypothetical protein